MSNAILSYYSNELKIAVDNSYHTASASYSIIPDPSHSLLSDPLFKYFARVSDPRSMTISTGILPPGVLFISDNLVIYERPPQYQNIFIIPHAVDNIDYENHSPDVYRLPVPWQLYIVSYTQMDQRIYPVSVRMFFMHNSMHLSDPSEQILYLPPLPNFYSNGSLCRPMYSDQEDIDRYSNDVSGVVHETYDWIWNSGTNLDLTMAIAEYCIQLKVVPKNFIKSINSYSSNSTSYPISLGSYYVDYNIINHFFNSWQSNLSIHNVSDCSWPTPSMYERSAIQHRDSDYFLSDYFEEMGIDPSYKEDCCEYDDCDCLPDYDRDHFYKYSRKRDFEPKTFSQILSDFDKSELRHLSRPSFFQNYLTKIITDKLISS